jgi:hypothetical protein
VNLNDTFDVTVEPALRPQPPAPRTPSATGVALAAQVMMGLEANPGKLIHTIPFCVYTCYGKDGRVEIHIEQPKNTVLIKSNIPATPEECDDANRVISEVLCAKGFVRYNSRLNFESGNFFLALEHLKANGTETPAERAALEHTLKRVQDLSGANGPEALAQCIANEAALDAEGARLAALAEWPVEETGEGKNMRKK